MPPRIPPPPSDQPALAFDADPLGPDHTSGCPDAPDETWARFAALPDAARKPGKRPPTRGAVRAAAVSPAPAAVADLFTASGRNPFRVPGPAVISFSGGRTSGMMTRKVLDAYGGALPSDFHCVFANTGAEDDRTLDFVHECGERWGLRIRWVEYDPEQPAGWKEVTYETASRDYAPFVALLKRRKALPNGRMRFCTSELKIRTMRGFMRAQGYADDEWTNIVGLRADEAHRVVTLRARPETKWDIAAPLYDAGVRKADVLRWWASQPFDLQTPEYAGNCVGCFHKGKNVRARAEAESPGVLQWWADMEAATGRRFVYREPEGYAGIIARVRLRVLNEGPAAAPLCPTPGEYDPADDETLPCDCTQRRAPPAPPPCICPHPRPRRGQPHTVMCAMHTAGGASDVPAVWYPGAVEERGTQTLERALELSARGVWRGWMERFRTPAPDPYASEESPVSAPTSS